MRGLRLIDRWLISRFASAYLTFTSAVLFVFVVIDLFANLDDLSEAGLLRGAYVRYATQLPELVFVISPFLALASALWVIAGLQRKNELTALTSLGFGPRRLTLPFLLAGLVLAPICWADRELLLPSMGHLRREAEFGRSEFEHPRPIPDGRDGVLAPRFYHPAEQRLEYVRYTRLDEQGGETLSIFARHGVPRGDGWLLTDGVRIERALVDGVAEDAVAAIGSEGLLLRVGIVAADVEAAIERPSFLSSAQLRAQIERTRAFANLEIQLYERFTYPLAGVVLLLIGVPVALRGRGGVHSFVRYLLCLGGSFLYFVLSTLCYELGSRGVLEPEVAAFFPVVACGALGLGLVLRHSAPG